MIVVVDLDGTLLDDRTRHHSCYRDILDELGHDHLESDAYWSQKRSGATLGEILALTGAGEVAKPFADAWRERIETPEYLNQVTVHAGALETLDRWRKQGADVTIATFRHAVPALTTQLERLDVSSHVERVVTADPSSLAEGKAAAVSAAVGGAKVDIWVGDTPVDIEAGRLLGARTWAVTCGVRDEKVLSRAMPDLIAADLVSLPPIPLE